MVKNPARIASELKSARFKKFDPGPARIRPGPVDTSTVKEDVTRRCQYSLCTFSIVYH